MSDNTAIEWADATWNPVTKLRPASPRCANCYAETLAERFRGTPGPTSAAASTWAAARRKSEPTETDQSQSMLWATYGLTTGTDPGAGGCDFGDSGSGCP